MQPPAAQSAPYGPPPSWAPPRRYPGNQVAIAVVGIVAAILIIGMIVMFTTLGGLGGFPVMLLAPFCFVFFILMVFAILAATGALRRTSLPPPPPIQQPMVPAGTQGPIALSCPNCGAPPVNVDRFGVATCTYCATRFIVR